LKENRSDPKYNVAHLIAYFGESARALDITRDKINAYIVHRQQAGASNSSINRETSCLKHMFNLMVPVRLSHDHVPSITRLQEAEPRQGFLEPAEFSRLREALPDYVKDPAEFLYLVGWRKSAMRSLEWSDCELELDSGELMGGTVHLRAKKSKNKRPFKVRLRGELLDLFRRAWANRIPGCSYVFHDDRGNPVGDFKKAWRAARRAGGLDSVLVHDMRRSCARNLDRSGVSQTVAMRITGHLTANMWRRYNITSDDDLENAMDKVSTYVTERTGETPKIVPLLTPRKKVA
jgi:integrase